MARSPLMAAAVLSAGLLLAACGSIPAPHPSASHTSSPTAKPSSSAKATPTPTAKPTSATAAAEVGFRAWAEAAVLLTGGGTGGLPVSSMPKSESDILVIDKGLHFPGWQSSLGQGLVLQEIPAGCEASILHVVGAFEAPTNAPVVVGAGPIALVVHFTGACTTQAGGVKYLTDPAGPSGTGTWVLLGSQVALPPVGGLPSLLTTVWSPVYRSSCASPWVQYAGSLLGNGAVVPGC